MLASHSTHTEIGGTGSNSVDVATAVINVLPGNHAPFFNVPGLPDFEEQLISEPTDANGAVGIVVTDLDEDGDVDVVAALFDGSAVAWYQNNGDGSYTAHTVATGVQAARQVEVADLDGDGDLDIVSASEGDDTIAWYQNDGNENFTKSILTDTARRAYDVAVVDLDGDGDTDVLSASRNDNNIAWYINDGNGNFSEQIIDNALPGARSVTTTDIDPVSYTHLTLPTKA